jgi:hypothetical protein
MVCIGVARSTWRGWSGDSVEMGKCWGLTTRRGLLNLLRASITSHPMRSQEDAYPTPSCTPFLVLISIRHFPSSFCGCRRKGCRGLRWLLPLLRARVFTRWRAGPSARPPERIETVVILYTCARQEVQKRGGQIRGIFKELLDFCYNLGLQHQALVWARSTSSSRTNIICTRLVIRKDL